MTPTETTITNATYATDDALLCMSDGTTRTTYFYSARGSLASKVEMTTSADCAANPPPTCAENDCAETTYGYDAMGNLTAVVLPDDTFIEYQSDAAGRRVAKRINGVVVARWLWDGQLRPIAELAPDGSVTSVFVYADGVNSPEYMVRGGAEYTFVNDALGSVRQVLDSNGVVMQAISYDAWGVPTATVGSLEYQPFGFAGGLYDSDTGLVRFGARDYDASLGRWTAKDPIRFGGGDMNLYAYSGNDPVNSRDPTGLYVEVIIWAPWGNDGSMFGHVTVDVNGTMYTYDGTMKTSPTTDYIKSHAFREGRGLIIDLESWEEKALEDFLAKHGGSYNIFTNNCGTPVQKGLQQLGRRSPKMNSVVPTGLAKSLSDLAIGQTYYPGTDPVNRGPFGASFRDMY